MLKKYWILLIGAAAFQGAALAQNNEAQLKAYEGEMGVFTQHHEHVTLEFEKDELVAHSNVVREILLLSDNAAGFFNTGSVYHSYFHTLENMEGASLVPSDKGFTRYKATKVRTKPSRSESVFYDDVKESEVFFTHLKKGAKTLLTYSMSYRDIHMLPKFYFQNYLPILDASFSVTFPKGLELEGLLQGADVDWIKKTVTENKKTTTITWHATNVPKAKVFSDAPRFGYYAPHLVIFIKNYTKPKSNSPVAVFNNVSDLNRYVYRFVENVNKEDDKHIADKVKELTHGLNTEDSKAAAIYTWVQNNIKYVAFEDSLGGFVPREASEVYRRRFGDCKDMAGLLRAMCSAAGMDARYVWIGTRDLPYSYNLTPVPSVFNHMICAVKVNGKWEFLDGTDGSIPYGVIPYGIQGKEALIGHTADAYEVVKMPENNSSLSTEVDSSFIKINEYAVLGNLSIHLSGYNAWHIKRLLKYKNEKEREDAFNAITSRATNKYAQKKFDFKLTEDPQKEVLITANFEVPDYVRKAGKDLYVNLNLHRSMADSRIDMVQRNAPVENDFKEIKKQVVVLDIPQGYKVSYIPDDVHKKVVGLGSYSIRYQSNDKTVTVSKELVIDALYIQPAQFKDFNQMVAGLQNAYKESVVLTAD